MNLIRHKIKKNGFYTIKHFFSKKEVSSLKKEFNDLYHSINLLPPHSNKIKKGFVKNPFKKMAIGATNGIGDPYAQFLITTYLSSNSKFHPLLSSAAIKIIKIRNSLLGIDLNYGLGSNDKFWNAQRIHFYPSGGGFMVQHKDSHFPKILRKDNLSFLQCCILLSNKGTKKCFTKGGFFIISNNRKVYLENINSAGNLVFFDGSITHGVDTIDPDILLNLDSSRGRLALFVNLYEKF